MYEGTMTVLLAIVAIACFVYGFFKGWEEAE
jgi:hypothetical protein